MFNLKKKNLIPLVFAVSSLVLLSLSILALRAPILDILSKPFSLAYLIQREAGGIIFYHRNLSENERLKRESDILKSKLNVLSETSLENTRLKNILYLKQKSSFKYIAANVIARPADNWSSGVIVDKGASSGIKRGMAVVTYLGLVGRVVEVSNSTSKIMLLNDPNLGVSSFVQRSRQEGLVCGTLGNNLIMKYLPEEADIKTLDVIVSSGLNNSYPKGLLIGTVIDIGKEFSGLSRYAIIKPAVNLSNIEEVLVVIS